MHVAKDTDFYLAKGFRVAAVEANPELARAGSERLASAIRDGRFWTWKPDVPALPELSLRRSPAVPEGWTLCAGGACRPVADAAETADVVTLRPCD